MNGLTFLQAQALVAHVTYKPGWTIRLTPVSDGQAELYVESPTWLSVVGTQKVSLHRTSIIDLEVVTEERLTRLVEYELGVLERHEMREWLRLDGVCVSQPHPEAT